MVEFQSLCVFCGSKSGANVAYEAESRRLGTLMAERGVRLVYGGGRIGLMGAIADAVADGGGDVAGISPEFRDPGAGGRALRGIFAVVREQDSRGRAGENQCGRPTATRS